MTRRFLVLFAGLVLVGGANRALAHHSFSAEYDSSQKVEIQGTVTEFVWRNPHSFVYVDVKQADGQTVRYLVEWASPAQLQGKVTRDTLQNGDHVVISGNPGRNQDDHRVRMLTFKRPKDGWSWGLLPDEQFK